MLTGAWGIDTGGENDPPVGRFKSAKLFLSCPNVSNPHWIFFFFFIHISYEQKKEKE